MFVCLSIAPYQPQQQASLDLEGMSWTITVCGSGVG
jgi:hypothetical protein